MDMLGTGAGFAGTHAHSGLTDFTGLDNLVSNGANDNMMVNHGGHHAHHGHLLHHHMPHHSHYSLAALTSPSTHPHSVTSSAHPSNQPLPPHRPFTPPGAAGSIGSHLLHSTTNSSLENNNSYSPNSTTTTSHLPSSTVKIKSGKNSSDTKF